MAILTSDFASLTDDLQDIFNEVAQTNVAEMVGNKIFRVQDTDRRTYDHLILHGLDGVQKVAQGADLPSATIVEGDLITWTQARYGALVSVTKDMRLFDLYDQIESVVRSISDDAFYKIDQSMADVLLYGFSASNYSDVYGSSVSATGPDGLALFSASHSNNINSNTFSNIITYVTVNPVLSREAVVAARKQGRVHKDPTGHSRPVVLDVLLVAPSKEDEAIRTIESSQISGSFENDINPLKGKVKVVCWEKLETRSDGTDTSAYWFMYDSRKVGESLRALFRERPTLDAPEQVYKNKNWDYSLDFYYTLGRGYPAYIFGSNATAA
jgi:hypothetical protein